MSLINIFPILSVSLAVLAITGVYANDEASILAVSDSSGASKLLNQNEELTPFFSATEVGNDAEQRVASKSTERQRLGRPGPPGRDGSIRIQPSRCVYQSANSKSCSSVYREPTGRCTTTANGRRTWGMAGTPFTRILSARYEDASGRRQLTESFSGNLLKSPRLISTTVTTTNIILNSEGVSAHTMQWGQFIAHEYTQLAEAAPNTACCADQVADTIYGRGRASAGQISNIRDILGKHRSDVCMPIELENDPVYKKDVCMNHIRSRPAPHHNCVPGPREQMNAITHVFDASNVYGSSQAEQDRLRTKIGGKLKTQTVKGVKLPPQNTAGCPASKKAANRCPFLAGDSRINTTPNLISTHTAFVNKHNQIATGLASQNPSWNDEKLFQEARKIISAIQSQIHFYEYLPIVLGSNITNRYKLGSYDGYNSNTNPSVLNELAGAACRFGHSTIDGFFSLIKDGGQSSFVDLRKNFFNSDIIYNDGARQCVRGLSEDLPWFVDDNFPNEVRDFLFDQNLDLAALSINRGRDHGFRPYVEYRKHYGLSPLQNWNDMLQTHPTQVVNQLKKVYTSVKDVELYIGGITEKPMPGALVGEVFGHIIADGFSKSRKGDRFFFESSQSGLKASQIASIKRYTYAQVLCEGTSLDQIVDKVFFRDGMNGARTVKCSSFPSLNFSLWKEGGNSNGGGCSWTVTYRSSCCDGRRTVLRRCKNQSSQCQCRGSSSISEKCRSSRFSRRCFRELPFDIRRPIREDIRFRDGMPGRDDTRRGRDGVPGRDDIRRAIP